MTARKYYWQGKIALITGGTSGIGLAISRYLAEQGAHVWLIARGVDGLESAFESLNYLEEQHCGMISADVTDWDQVSSAFVQVETEIGWPDLVVNSAGVAHPGYFQDLELEIFHWMIDVNFFGTVNVCKAVVPGMIARGSGHIINISSGAGFIGRYGYSAYGASKYAVRGFTDVLRSELKPHGIHVSIVFPPDVDTPQLTYEQMYQPPETKALSGIANLISPSWEGRSTLMSPEEIADSIMINVERERYLILPGFEMKLLYWLTGIIGSGIYPILDWLIARAQRGNHRGD
jgi:3-dehydrosphinganine reductase